MSLATDLRSDPTAALDALRAAVERGASVLAGANRAAGPATPQDDTADLVPAPDALGMSVALDGGIQVIVLLTGDLAEELTGSREAVAVASTLAPVGDEIATALGSNSATATPLDSPAALDALLTDAELVVASGVFADDAVVATVAVSMAAAGAVPAASNASQPAADPGTPPDAAATAPSPASALSTGDAPSSGSSAGSGAAPPNGPASAVPPRSVTSAAANSDAPPPPFIGDAALTRGLSILAEVSLEVTAELGRAALRVSELLDLQPGSIIELDREAGAPVELFVNGTLFARAEVVVVDGQYAVRICELFGGEGPR